MKNRSSDNTLMFDYAQSCLRDSKMLPMALLRGYKELDLSERELIILLRLIAHCYQTGNMSIDDIAQEFGVDNVSAKSIAEPFVTKRLLEQDMLNGHYSCDGLKQQLFLLWVDQQQIPGDLVKNSADSFLPASMSSILADQEKEQFRQMGKLYRSFERELGRPLKYTESDCLRSWIDDDKFSPELVEEALRRSVLQDKCSLAYIGSILRSWQKKHLTTLQMVIESDIKPLESSADVAQPVQEIPVVNRNRKKATVSKGSKYDFIYNVNDK